MNKTITFISDTHTKHKQCEMDLPGGDILIHCGDFMSTGWYWEELKPFLNWFNSLNQYTHKIFIAGNHDRLFETDPFDATRLVREYQNIIYLEDSQVEIDDINEEFTENNIHIYGLPHTPEFHSWAFNVPRNSHEMQKIINNIPDNTDILITHGPPYGILDTISPHSYQALGCEILRDRIKQIRPKICCFGHIHGGRGIKFIDGTLYINASILNEQYQYTNKPITIDFNFNTGEFEIIVK